MRFLAPDAAGKQLRALDSGLVTVMVYGFLSPLELLGTRRHMPFVTYRGRTSVSSAANNDQLRSSVGHKRPGHHIKAASSSVQLRYYNELDPMILRQATPVDIPAIVAIERTPFAREFVGQWSEERHRTTLEGGDARYYVSETEWGEVQGYVILRGINEDSHAIELKRIVVAVPERGLGRGMLKEVMRIAFRDLGAHRLFLDVYEDNGRARHLYESLGFQYEGVMREAANRDGRWCNLRLMSILESEYAGF